MTSHRAVTLNHQLAYLTGSELTPLREIRRESFSQTSLVLAEFPDDIYGTFWHHDCSPERRFTFILFSTPQEAISRYETIAARCRAPYEHRRKT